MYVEEKAKLPQLVLSRETWVVPPSYQTQVLNGPPQCCWRGCVSSISKWCWPPCSSRLEIWIKLYFWYFDWLFPGWRDGATVPCCVLVRSKGTEISLRELAHSIIDCIVDNDRSHRASNLEERLLRSIPIYYSVASKLQTGPNKFD